MLPNMPFYSELFKKYKIDPFTIKSVEDWQKQGLPLIKKSTYLKNPKEFIVQAKPEVLAKNHFLFLDNQNEYGEAIEFLFKKEKTLKEYYIPHSLIFSGGTENVPAPMFLTKAQDKNLQEILMIIGQMMMTQTRTVGMNLFPYAPHLGWHSVHKALDLNADLNLNTAGAAMRTEKLISIADAMKPNIICGMNDYLRNRWLPMAIKQKIKLPEKVMFVNGAQKINNYEREQIKKMAAKLGVKQAIVMDFYGASELKETIMPECKPNSGYHHIAPLNSIIKTVQVNNSDEELITDWEFTENGYAAVWNIDGAGTLLEGYLLGDRYDKVTYEKCPNCGLNTMKIYGINRIREVEAQIKLTGIVEEKIKGSRINLVEIRDKALAQGAEEAQVYLNRTKKILELRIIGNKQIKEKLEKSFEQSEIRPKVVIVKDLIEDKLKFEKIKIE